MNKGAEILISALAEAGNSGSELAPSELLSAVEKQPDPMPALSDCDKCNEFFEAIQNQFEFIRFTKVTGKTPSVEEANKLVALLRWLIRELQQWREANDVQHKRLTVLFITAQYCDMGDKLWSTLPSGLESNTDLLGLLEKLVSGYSISFTIWNGGLRPISDGEAIEKFKQADIQGDWLTIGEMWRYFEHVFFSNVILTQIVRCLHRFGFDRLVQAVSGIGQTAVVAGVVSALSTEDRLKLATDSDNAHIQFGAVYQTFFTQHRKHPFTEAEQQPLVKLLGKVAQDAPRWGIWMQIFNCYPMRYPALQKPLGMALATATDAAIAAYVDSIKLNYADDDSRKLVAECLSAFRQTAPTDRRKSLWDLAHKRWEQWQFASADKDRHLFKIEVSVLDYSIVGYATECMTETQRGDAIINVCAKLNLLENRWHKSISDCISDWNRLLSQLQPYAHASEIAKNQEDWLVQGKTYTPCNLKDDQYLAMMFNV